MLIPGLDLIRLFINRILNNKKFFEPDLNHIHHILIKSKNKYLVQLIILLFNISPVIVAEVVGSYLVGIMFGIVSYFLLIKKA